MPNNKSKIIPVNTQHYIYIQLEWSCCFQSVQRTTCGRRGPSLTADVESELSGELSAYIYINSRKYNTERGKKLNERNNSSNMSVSLVRTVVPEYGYFIKVLE